MSRDRPLVSILTPSYNQGRYIGDTIESVLAQDYPYVEHIVVDGGSDDETPEVLGRYNGRISYTCEPDRGQADALNKAFGRAQGSIIGWLNSDDFYVWDGVVTKVVEAFELGGSALDVVYGHSIWVDDRNRVVKLHPRPDFSASRLERFDYLSQPATFFRSGSVGAPLVDVDSRYTLDYRLWLRLLHDGKTFHRLAEYLAAMRYHGSAKSVRARDDAWDEDFDLRSEVIAARRGLAQSIVDLGVMAGMKVRGLADYRSNSLHASRWCIPLTLPATMARPLYQAGVLGSPGSAFLLPRYLFSSKREPPGRPT
jgi:hypothetical protein